MEPKPRKRPAPLSPSRAKRKLLTIKVSELELAAVNDAAARARLTAADYVRSRIPELDPRRQP